MKILFVTSNRVGDAVLSTGLLRHLLAAHPAARFTIACGPYASGVFERMPRRDRTIIVDKRPWNRHWPSLWRAVSATRWDLAVDLRGSALTYALRARRRAVMRTRTGPKIAQLAAVLGVSPPPLPIAWWNEADRAVAERLTGPGPILALAPTANWNGKMWPADRFAAAALALLPGMPGARIAILGGPGAAEHAAARLVLDRLPGAIDLAGRLTLAQAAALLSRAELFIGNDSGLMHLAAAAGAPTIGLFGPTPIAQYAPAGPRARGLSSADGTMAGLTVASVSGAARELLANQAPP